MIVAFDASALANPEATGYLDSIVTLFEEGRHKWWVPDPDILRKSRWYLERIDRARRRVDVLLSSAKTFPRPHASTVSVVVGGDVPAEGGVWHLQPRDAWMLLQQPLRLLVEDAKTDGAFLRAVLLRFGEVRLRRHLGADEWQKVKSAWTETARGDGIFFKIVHGGGSRIADELTARWAGNQAPPSALIAVVDSDRCSPDVPFEPAHGTTWHAAQVACDEVAVRPNVPHTWTPSVLALERRAMENYLPLGALSARYNSGRKKETADSYVQLVPVRRHHYHVKGGLRTALEHGGQTDICSQPRGSWTWRDDLQQSLYAAQGPWGPPLSNSALEALCPGLGNDPWMCWRQDHTTINRASLRAEAGDELERLLDHIIQRV